MRPFDPNSVKLAMPSVPPEIVPEFASVVIRLPFLIPAKSEFWENAPPIPLVIDPVLINSPIDPA